MIKNDKNLYHKIFKYLIMGLSIYLAAKYIPNKPIDNMEILMLSFIASITFAILDMICPSITTKNN